MKKLEKILIILGVLISIQTNSDIMADTQTEQCLVAQQIGYEEGRIIFESVKFAEFPCLKTAENPLYYWTEAHVAKVYLWEMQAFPPLTGLESVQPCRIFGQNGGINESQKSHLDKCLQ